MTPEEREYLLKFLHRNPSLPESKAEPILTPLLPQLKSYQETKEAARRVAETSIGPPMVPTKYERESAAATWLLQFIDLPYTSMSDPLKTYGYETGADVEIRYDGCRIGIQVTEFSADRGVTPTNRGLRAKNASDAAQGELTRGWIPLAQQLPALVSCILDKIKKASHHGFEEFDEVWLVVATFVPWAPVPTFQLPGVTISTEDLRCYLTDKLRRSKFTRVFICNVLYKTVYEWSSVTGWRCVHEGEGLAAPASAGAKLWFKPHLADPEIRRDPKGWAFREAERVLNELRGVSNDRSQA